MIRCKLWDEARAKTRKSLLFLGERSTAAQLAESLGMTTGAGCRAGRVREET